MKKLIAAASAVIALGLGLGACGSSSAAASVHVTSCGGPDFGNSVSITNTDAASAHKIYVEVGFFQDGTQVTTGDTYMLVAAGATVTSAVPLGATGAFGTSGPVTCKILKVQVNAPPTPAQVEQQIAAQLIGYNLTNNQNDPNADIPATIASATCSDVVTKTDSQTTAAVAYPTGDEVTTATCRIQDSNGAWHTATVTWKPSGVSWTLTGS